MQLTLQVSSTPAHFPGRPSTQQPPKRRKLKRGVYHKQNRDLFKHPNIIKQYQTSPCLLCLSTVAKTEVRRGGLATTARWCECANIIECAQMMPNAPKCKIKRLEIFQWSRVLNALAYFMLDHTGQMRDHQKLQYHSCHSLPGPCSWHQLPPTLGPGHKEAK